MKEILITAAAFLSLSLNAFAQGPPWQPNGQNMVYTGRAVGINTNTPAYTLDVDGIIRSSVLSGGNGIVSYNNDGVLQQIPFTQSVQDVLRGDGTWGSAPFTSHWTLTGNDISYSLGAVSVGTDTALGAFTVAGASFFNGDVAVNGVLSVTGRINADTIGTGTTVVPVMSGTNQDFAYRITRIPLKNVPDDTMSTTEHYMEPKNQINELESAKFDSDVWVYPNPAKEYIIVTVLNNNSNFDVSIMNLLGQEVLNRKVHKGNSQVQISLNHLPPGVYIVLVSTGTATYATKIVKE